MPESYRANEQLDDLRSAVEETTAAVKEAGGSVNGVEKYLQGIEQNLAWVAKEQQTANLIALWGSGALSVKQRIYVMGRIRKDLMVPEEMG